MNLKLSDYRCRPNRTNLFLERMEERTTPTVTVNLIGNELKLTYGAASDAVTFSNEGNSISISYTGDEGQSKILSSTSVNKITVTDAGNAADQKLEILPGTPLTLSNGFSSSGVETVVIRNAINAGGGTAAISINAPVSVGIEANLTGGSGGVSIFGNQASSATTQSIGVAISAGAVVTTTNNGNVSVTGNGGDLSTEVFGGFYGVLVEQGAKITSGGKGTVTVTGEGGDTPVGTGYGVLVRSNAEITSSGGAVVVNGTGAAVSSDAYGILISGGRITSGGLGSLTVTGTGGANSRGGATGVNVSTAGIITSSGGNVTVTGTGGGDYPQSANFFGNNNGVLVSNGQITAGGAGTVTVTGVGGGRLDSTPGNHGVSLSGSGIITSSGGNVVVKGTGGGGSSTDLLKTSGVFLSDSSKITSGTKGPVTVTGIPGYGIGNLGVKIADVNSEITSGGGKVVINQKASQTITWSAPVAIVQGTPLSELQLNASVVGDQGGLPAGELTYTPSLGTVLQAGTRTLTVTAAATDNYLEATRTVQIFVAVAPVLTAPASASFVANRLLPLTGLSVSDADGLPSSILTLSASVSSGTLNQGNSKGSSLSFAGTKAAATTWLAGLGYQSAADSVASTTIILRVTDTSSVLPQTVTKTIELLPLKNIGAKVIDPSSATKTNLTIQGTDNADSVWIRPSGASTTTYLVTLGARTQTVTGITGKILVFGFAGNDSINLESVKIATRVDSGDGNDIVMGGSAADIIFGGNGADLLIGGLGADFINGYFGNDILVDGTVALTQTGDTLVKVLTTWASVVSPTLDTYNSITTRLRYTADTAARDTLIGGRDSDWLWSSLTQLTGVLADYLDTPMEKRRTV